MAGSGSDSQTPRTGFEVRRIGLTGNIGSGKSTAARLLAEQGSAVIDADTLAKQAAEDRVVLDRIRSEFGPSVLSDGRLDRTAMARLVFADPGARLRLERIIHPWVRARARVLEGQLLESASPPPLIVHDIPLLFESGLERHFDAVVVVSAPAETRAARTEAGGKLSAQDFAARDRAQWPLERKEELADHVLDNSGDLASLRAQVAALWPKLLTS